MNSLKIYSVPTYKTTIEKAENITGDINTLLSEVKKDKQYHERILYDSLIKMNIDLDGYDIDTFRIQFKEYLYNVLGLSVEIQDFKYTFNSGSIYNTGKKKGEKKPSYHVVIPQFYGSSYVIKAIFEDFKKSLNLSKEEATTIDAYMGATGTGIWFRLPNQTKEGKKGTEHIIKNGKLSQFILHYIPEDCICINDLDTVKELLKPKPEIPKSKKVKQDNTNEEEEQEEELPINLDLSNEYNQYLNLIPAKQLYDYNDWLKLGFLIFSLGLPCSVWDELSKKSKKYEEGACQAKWKTFTRKQYTAATLYYWAKLGNPEEYQKLRQINNYNNVFGSSLLVDTIKFNKRYLIEDKKDKLLLNHFNDFFNNNELKTLSIKSPYGTGKTQLLKTVIQTHKPQRVLWISYRITLTNDILYNFKELGFQSYQELNYNADRLIIQLESLMKIDNTNDPFLDEGEALIPSYDLVVIDEIESILGHFSSDTFKGSSRDIFEYLQQVIKVSSKVVALDGDMNNRSYDFLRSLGSGIYLENECNVNDKTIKIVEKEPDFLNNIKSNIEDDKKVVICSMSSAAADHYYNTLSIIFPSKVIYVYTGKTDDNQKREHLLDVSEAWKEADVVIYSPTIESGVNFDIDDHFYKIYGVLSCQSTSQRAFYQMLSRVRKVQDKEIMILNEGIPNKDTANFWGFDEVKAGLIATRDNILQYKYIEREGKTIKTLSIDQYDLNSIYNRVEELNKNSCYFMAYFRQLGKAKHYTFTTEEIFIDEEDTGDKKKESKESKRRLQLVNALDISCEAYEEKLRIQKAGKATALDKLLIEKHYYKLRLGVDLLDEEILKGFYKNEYIIKNFIHLLDKGNFKDGNDDKTESKKAKLKIIHKLINQLGFENIYDDKMIKKENFDNNLRTLILNNELFTDKKTTKILFGLSKSDIDTTSNKAVLGYVNSILENYCLKIEFKYTEGKKKIAQNGKYHLIQLYGINEIVDNLMRRGYPIIDENNIMKPVENQKFKHLIIPEKPKINYDSALLDNGVEPNIEANLIKAKVEEEPSKITIIKQTKIIFDIDFTDY